MVLLVLAALAALGQGEGAARAPLFRASPLLARAAGGDAAAAGEPVRTVSGERDKDWIVEVNGGGVLLGDLDGSGSVDLLVVDGSTVERASRGEPGEPPRVYLNGGAADFVAAGGAWAMAPGRWGTGGALGDVDGDGDLDAVVTQWGPDRIFLNRDGAGLDERTEGSGLGRDGWSTSAAFLDAELDGDLDLFVVRYLEFDPTSVPSRASGDCVWKGHAVMCGPEGLVPTGDALYLGRGDGTFEDASERAGITAVAPAYGLGVVTGDLDGDGRTDLYVSNDSLPNHLWRNLGDGRFEEIGMRAGAALDANGREQAGMGVAIGDADGDGHHDLFVTNFSGEANAFYRSNARGPRLRWNDRAHAARLAGPSVPLLGWGTQMADFDHDGDQDLAVVNGHVYPQADAAGTDTSYAQGALLHRGAGEGRFDTEPLWGDARIVGRAAAFADLDGDGDLDGVALELDGPLWRLENVSAGAPSLQVALEGRGANRQGLGAKVEVTAGGRTLVREVTTAGGFQSALPATVHFGLGGARRVERLRVRWPSGAVSELADVAAGRVVVAEPERAADRPSEGSR